MNSIVENLKEIAGSLPEGVKLVAVSKTKPVEAIVEAYAAVGAHQFRHVASCHFGMGEQLRRPAD